LNIEMAGPWLTQLEEDTVLDAVRNGWYGPKKYWYVENFETEFARYHGRKYALMTPNCTTAIHLLLLGLGIKAGDEVIVPECTWIATAAPITHVGATTVFADIDPDTFNISPQAAAAAVTGKTKAVIPVDLFGQIAAVDAVRAAPRRSLVVRPCIAQRASRGRRKRERVVDEVEPVGRDLLDGVAARVPRPVCEERASDARRLGGGGRARKRRAGG